TIFKIFLPRLGEPAEAASADDGHGVPGEGTETILLVEDDPRVLALARRRLVMYGYTVLEATHPEEALRICQEHEGPIHLLLTDVVLPVMTGVELRERSARLRPEMKALFMSGYSSAALAYQGASITGVPFVSKPFTVRALACKVREALTTE